MAKQKQKRPRTYARNRTKGYHEKLYESDSTYFLKLVVYALIGTLWLRFADPVNVLGLPVGALPIGLMIGLLLVRRFEKYQSNRKIWYAILLIVAIVGNFMPIGLVV
jgi:hypothetical protein